MTPLVPACVDLRDFAFMPMEFARLFASDTWTLSNDAEKVAAITLWGKSWTQVPAGSLPDNDRLLSAHSGAGPRWKRVKEMALRGWKRCDDGRLYHPVVCEKALEAWLEKLSSRLSSGAGNAKRWGIEFDPSEIEAQITDARRMLAALNPQSRALTKKRPPGVPSGSKKPPSGNPPSIPPGVPSGSQETGTGTVRAKAGNSSSGESEASTRDDDGNPPAPPDAVPGEQDLPDWVPRAEWREFYAHRGVIRKPLSLFGQREVVKRLVELRNDGHNLAESLRQTMRAGLAIPVIPKEADGAGHHARGSPSQKSKTLQAIENIDRTIANVTSQRSGLDTPRIGNGPEETALPAPGRLPR